MGRPRNDLDDYLDWQERLESFKASGLSIDEFCLQEGVSRSTYYRWVDQLKDGVPESMVAEKAAWEEADSGEAAFVPITLKASPVEIELPNGGVVRLPLPKRRLCAPATGRVSPGSRQAGRGGGPARAIPLGPWLPTALPRILTGTNGEFWRTCFASSFCWSRGCGASGRPQQACSGSGLAQQDRNIELDSGVRKQRYYVVASITRR